MFGSIQWGNPLWAWGLLAAVGLPVLAHLFSRRRARRVVFPAVRLLSEVSGRSHRGMRLRQWLLLAMRCLLLALIVAACARPEVSVDGKRSETKAEAGRIVVMLLDRSASMSRVRDGASLVEQAKAGTAARLGRLEAGRDRAVVVLIDSEPSVLGEGVTGDLDGLKRLVAQVEPSHEKGDVAGALRLGARLADAAWGGSVDLGGVGREEAGQVVEFVAFSDLQATQWPGDEAIRRLTGGRAVSVVALGGGTRNLSIGSPVLHSTRPVSERPMRVSFSVRNFGEGVATATVRATLNGIEARRVEVEVQPWSEASGEVTVVPARSGMHQLELSLVREDGLGLDDRTGLFAEVGSAQRVALVTWGNVTKLKEPAGLMALALMPGSRGNLSVDGRYVSDDAGHLELAAVRPTGLADLLAGRDGQGARTPRPDVLVLVDSGSLKQDALQAMRRFVEQGGGVVWLADSQESVASLRGFDGLSPRIATVPIVPAEGVAWREMSLKQGWGLRAASGRERLQLLEPEQLHALLKPLWFRGTMVGERSPGAQLLLEFEDGEPAVATQFLGAGRLTVAGFAMDPDRSNLAMTPFMVPLVHELVKLSVEGSQPALNVQPGQAGTARVEVATQRTSWRLVSPGGKGVYAGVVERGQELVSLPRLMEAGAYRVMAGERLLGGVYVEIDPAESDLRVKREGAREAGTGSDAGRGAREGEAADDGASAIAAGQGGRRVELWPYLLAGVLMLAAVEHGAVGWLGRRN